MKKLKDYIILFDKVMPLILCEKLIEAYDSVSKEDPNYVRRKNEVFDFAEINMLDHKAFSPYCKDMMILMQSVNKEYMKRTSSVLKNRIEGWENFKDFETPRVKRYEPNQGIFDWHVDSADAASSRRALVMFWYLNNVEEGGETEFDIGETISVKPKAGSVVCFPPYYLYPHKGCMPISGPKYVISSYALLPQQNPTCEVM
jgi:hypothetical protein